MSRGTDKTSVGMRVAGVVLPRYSREASRWQGVPKAPVTLRRYLPQVKRTELLVQRLTCAAQCAEPYRHSGTDYSQATRTTVGVPVTAVAMLSSCQGSRCQTLCRQASHRVMACQAMLAWSHRRPTHNRSVAAVNIRINLKQTHLKY